MSFFILKINLQTLIRFTVKWFFQVQFLVKLKSFEKIMGEISSFFEENKIFSSFVILKL